MIKILLVEDQPEKKREILTHLDSLPDIDLSHVMHADNAIDAKRLLKSTKFDLLILDLNIPKRAVDNPSKGEGLDILSFIKNNQQAKAPTYIYGMTAFDDEFSNASSEFSSALWKLVKYDSSNTDWRNSLSAAAVFLASQDRPPYQNDGTTFHVDIGIVVALDEELSPFREILGPPRDLHIPHDHTRYFSWEKESSGRLISIVAVVSPRMGLPTAAVITTKLINSFRPRYVITSGICAVVKGKTRMGDLLVADPSFDWGSGKWIKETDGSLTFRPAAYPWRLPEALRLHVITLAEDKNFLEKINFSYKHARPTNPPEVLIDPVASGGSVLQADSLMSDVRAHHKNLVGVEMENYGVLTAVEYCGSPQPKAIAVKAVCDFGDGDKNDEFHSYAAHVSASFVCRLIEKLDYES